MPNILILGARSPASLTWARLLAKAGYRVHMADSMSYALSRYSRYIVSYTRLPLPKSQTGLWLEELIKLLTQEKIHTIIPNCEEVFYLASANDLIQQIHPCQLFTSSISLLTQLHHKGFFAQLTQNWPVSSPDTLLLTNQAEFTLFKQQQFSADKQWVFKPAFSRFATQTLICPHTINYNQLQASPQQPWVAQKYISGKEYCSYSIIRHGKVIAHSCYHPKYRIGKGAGIYFNPAQHLEIREFVEYFAAQTHYHGQVGFDFIQDASGKIFVLECNPRATSGIHFMTALSQTIQTSIVQTILNLDMNSSVTLDEMNFNSPQMHSLSMLLTPQQWRFWKNPTFWHDHNEAQDIVWEKGDTLPYWAQFMTTTELLLRAIQLHITPLAATTADIEWDGMPIVFN